MNKLYGFDNERNLILNNYQSKTLPNSIIIYGQKGIGKNTFIINILKDIFSKSLNENQIDHHLNLIDNYTHPNIKYIGKEFDNKLNKIKEFISIEQIRKLNNFINEFSINDFDKFIIIDSLDYLKISSLNSLLKLLEEPKNNTYIILISHQFSSIIPTIRSRCLKLKFSNHNFETFKKILNEKINNIVDEETKFLFDLTNGSPGLALELQDEEVYSLYIDILNSLIEKDPLSKNNLIFSNKISALSNDKFKIFLSVLKFILINLNKLKLDINIFDQYLSDKIKILKQYSSKVSKKLIYNQFEYLINNENDLFAYNLDKKIFLLNFFAEFDN